MNTRDSAKAFDALMQETPYSHFDSGCECIIPECRTCRFHRPFWKYTRKGVVVNYAPGQLAV